MQPCVLVLLSRSDESRPLVLRAGPGGDEELTRALGESGYRRNGLHPEFTSLVDYLRSEPIKLTITSNGYSIEALDDAAVTAFHDIEFSLDYPTQAEQDRQRGPGNWHLIHEQAARCRELGLSVTFIAVMMRSNFDRLAEIAAIVKAYDAPLRINVYQSVRSDAF